MPEPGHKIESPCVRKCCLNDENICLGCFRSLDEICDWSGADAARREQILASAEQRRQQSGNQRAAAAQWPE